MVEFKFSIWELLYKDWFWTKYVLKSLYGTGMHFISDIRNMSHVGVRMDLYPEGSKGFNLFRTGSFVTEKESV